MRKRQIYYYCCLQPARFLKKNSVTTKNKNKFFDSPDGSPFGFNSPIPLCCRKPSNCCTHERTNGDAQERRGWCRGWAGTAGETATTTCDIPGRLDACGCSFSSLYFHRPFSHFPPFLIIYYFVPFLYYIDFVSNIGGQVKKKKSRLRKFAGMKLAFTPKWTNWASESRQVNESPRLGLGTQHQLPVPWSGLRLHPQRRLKKKKEKQVGCEIPSHPDRWLSTVPMTLMNRKVEQQTVIGFSDPRRESSSATKNKKTFTCFNFFLIKSIAPPAIDACI